MSIKRVIVLLLLMFFSLVIVGCKKDDVITDPEDDKYITVHYESNGGNEIESVRIKEEEKNSFSTVSPEREGYIFRGWCTDSECVYLFFGLSEVEGEEEITLYAKWEEIVPEPEVVQFDVKEEDYPEQIEITKKGESDVTYYLNGEMGLKNFFTNLNKVKYHETPSVCGVNSYVIKYGDVTILVYFTSFIMNGENYKIDENDFYWLDEYNSENTDKKLSESTGWLPFV